MSPASTAPVATSRLGAKRSPRNNAPITAAKGIEVSRSTATSATGARVIVHSTIG